MLGRKILRVAALAATFGLSIGAFATSTNQAGAAAGSDFLSAGQTLTAGQALVNGPYTLYMQSDGNLVEYQSGTTALWETYSNSGNHLTMQTDGNLVMYTSAGGLVWQTGTQGYTGDQLILQSDGNIVLYASNGTTPLWAKSWTQSASGAQAYSTLLMANHGWATSQEQYVNDIFTNESNWTWNAYNPTPCSGGGNAYGIPQSCPGSKMSAFGSDWYYDGLTQIQWGLSYIQTVYGTPQAAWAHWQTYHSYIVKS